MAAVRNGVGREAAHEAIKEAAVGTALAMRAGQADNDVFAKLAADDRLGLTRDQIDALVADPHRVHRCCRGPDPGGRAPGSRRSLPATPAPRRTSRARSSRTREGSSSHDGPMTIAVEARVTGRVQGVSFRWYTQEQARRLGVVGWVRNEVDGSVLLHAEGDQEAVDALVEWCRTGPALARVRGVAVRESSVTGATSFDVGY